jgi:hypothetical protein
MNEYERQPPESAGAWLRRLTGVNVSGLPVERRRAQAGYLAEARRLVQQEQQQARWGNGRRG